MADRGAGGFRAAVRIDALDTTAPFAPTVSVILPVTAMAGAASSRIGAMPSNPCRRPSAGSERNTVMTLFFDCFWSFRSPYSYLLVPRLVALEREFDVRCKVRIVRPIAVRQPEFFSNGDPLWISYLMRDTVRTAQFLGMNYRWPRPDPVRMDIATRTYPVEQPHIHRLSRLGQLAAEQGDGLPFIAEVSRLIWDGRTDDWHEGDHLARAAAKAGCDLPAMDATLAVEGDRLATAIEANEAAQRAVGHYGVPLMAFDGEPLFGQDRFDQLCWRLKAAGLAPRHADEHYRD